MLELGSVNISLKVLLWMHVSILANYCNLLSLFTSNFPFLEEEQHLVKNFKLRVLFCDQKLL